MRTILQKRREEGFTIIEVLIVLAIAGLIMLIVFLAVPALQRNSRNTAAKNDVQNVLGGVSEYMGANTGAVPTKIAGTGTIAYTGATGSNATEVKIQGSTEVITQTGSVPQNTTTGPNNGLIHIYLGQDCNGATNKRAVSAVYSIETANNKQTFQCAES